MASADEDPIDTKSTPKKRGRPRKVPEDPGAEYRRYPTLSPKIAALIHNDPTGFGKQATPGPEVHLLQVELDAKDLIKEILEFVVRRRITEGARAAAGDARYWKHLRALCDFFPKLDRME